MCPGGLYRRLVLRKTSFSIGFKFKKRIDICVGMENGVGCLELGGRLEAIAEAHFRPIFDWAASGRSVLWTILEKL